MIESKEKKFYIKFLDKNEKEFNVFKSKDKYEKPFVVGEKGCEFKIKMIVSDRLDRSKHYGSKLNIDGEDYKSIKTFKRVGTYFGFKLGNGQYRAFQFNNSRYDCNEESNAANEYRNIGRITIRFFRTTQIKFKNTRSHGYDSFNVAFTNPGKKQCMNSIQVGEGREFDNGHQHRMRNKHLRDKFEDEYTNILDEDKDIDEVEINYIDYYGLIARGYINTRTIDHLVYIPYRVKEYLNNSVFKQAILRIVEEITNDVGLEISIKTLSTKFKQITEHNIEEHLGNYRCLSEYFLAELPDLIESQNEDTIKIKLDKPIKKLYQDDTYIIPSSKVLTGKEIEYLKKKKLNKTNSILMEIEPQAYIDLTLDDNEFN